ncbi:Bax inhibitor-1/YccA family membrane protein [Malacoplasma penetrans]|nr:Bax inhibitor-1/YccA family protein [Malacoplasma penetrans]
MNKGYFASSNNNAYHVEGYKTTKLKYNKKQMSVLNIGMLTAGLGFLYVAAIGFILEYAVFLPLGNEISQVMLLSFASVGIIVGSIMSMIWAFRVHKASLAFGLITILIYTTAYGIGFGSLFAYLQQQFENQGLLLIMSVFGIVGLIFIGTFAVVKLMSLKAFVTFSKIVMVASIFGFIAMMGLIIASIFLVGEAYRTIAIVVSVIGILMAVLFLAYDLWLAQNMDKFYVEEGMNAKMGLFIGFQILINLIMMLFYLLRLVALLADNRIGK